MKKQFNRILVVALAVAMMFSTFCTAFAATGSGGFDPGAGAGSIGEDPVYVDYGNTVTFKDGGTYNLTAQPGTSKNKDGDVLVGSVSGTIALNRIPAVAGSDAYYNFIGWAIENKDGVLEFVDLTTYKFYKATTVYAITEDTWPPYNDMKQDRTDWFYSYVRDLSIGGIVNGYEGYVVKPQGNVTWGEALKMIMLATGYEAQPATEEHWAGGYLAKAEEDGLVAIGYVTDLNKAITRLEYATVAAMAMGLKDVTMETPFADTEDQKVLNLYDAKIIEGSFDLEGNRLFKPNDNITRAEMFTVIWRINNYYKAK